MWTREHSSIRGPALAKGFTLVELMVAAALSTIILAAVFSAFIFLARGSFRLGQYNDMETQARRALHQFSQDARQAENASWPDDRTLVLTVGPNTVTYAYDAVLEAFTRKLGGTAPVPLATGVTAFEFKAYQRTGAEVPDNLTPAAAGAATKMVQIEMNLARTGNVTAETTGQIISARCVLRNKKSS